MTNDWIHPSRRTFLDALAGAIGLRWLGPYSSKTIDADLVAPVLSARPGKPTLFGSTGRQTFTAPEGHGGIFVASGVDRLRPAPLLLFLHGANRTVDAFLDRHRTGAERARVIVLAPFAAVGTWDAVRNDFGPDVVVLDAALRWVFARWTIDPNRIVISGFSDGATYSLAIGRANGDLFSRIVAYSPGFLVPVPARRRPPILITHGTSDPVLPIEDTSRRIVPVLREAGYPVDYREFDGSHAVQQSVLEEVVDGLGSG